MNWFSVKTIEDKKITINGNYIMSFQYDKENDETIIDYAKSGWNSTFVKGDITLELRRLLNAHGDYVTQIGG